jgi:hypothetical protein
MLANLSDVADAQFGTGCRHQLHDANRSFTHVHPG